ncbi:hypothetical protein [Sphaerisporangium aureirubrum]|uniref:Uncharacterized protein n=1 Tax=Sphaerisporangium aureirubrum TaxID=1544736 RepID=A0ABW1NB23_9ACTN
MINVRSYLRTSGGEFVAVDEFAGSLGDPDYVEGAIEVEVDGRAILGKDQWDYVDELWFYITDMVEEMRSTGQAATYFPDQPISLSFRRIAPAGRVMLTCEFEVSRERRTATLTEEELLAELRRSGGVFFERLAALLPGHSRSYSEALERLRA